MKKIYKIMTLLCCLSVLAVSNEVSAQCTAPLLELTIDITADQYPGENTWSLTEDGVEIAFGGGDDQNIVLCVDPSLCYEFTMADSYGDGQLGSAFGGVDGTTTITLDGTEVFTSTGDWGTSISGNLGGCVAGCGDVTANNYDATADSFDNSLCTYDLVQGCTDELACNYDSAAEQDNGSCTFADAGFDCDGNCLSGVALTIDITADQYPGENTWSLTEAGVEIANGGGDDQNIVLCVDETLCYEFTMADSYGDGQLGSAFGGVDGTTTITFDGTEVFTSTGDWGTSISGLFGGCVTGCGDIAANNYDATADIIDNSLCTYDLVQGCTDELACNYDSAAEEDNGSCTFADAGFDCDGNCLSGFVALTIDITADQYPGENTWSLTEDGIEIANGGGDDQNIVLCVDPSLCYEFTMADSYGDGQLGSAFGGVDGTTTITLDGTEVFTSTGDWGASISGNFGGCVTGCGDITANNYDATADIIDNSLCTYDLVQGCTDETACNYDIAAEQDNGSCTFPDAGFDCDGNCLSGVELIIAITADQYPGENTWSLIEDGVNIAFGGGEDQNVVVCADPSKCYEFTMADSYGDGQLGSAFGGVDGTTTITLDGTEVFTSTGDWGASISGNFGGGCGVFGCADPLATNYDPAADSCDGIPGGSDISCCTFPLANDDCANAIAVACGDVILGSTETSTIGSEVFAPSCGTDIEGPGIWYSFASSASEEVTFSLCGSALDTKINVYSGTCGAFVCAGGNDDFCGLQSEVSIITAAAPTTYLVHVSGWNGGTGEFQLAVTCSPSSCTPPINDTCDGALPVPDATPFIDDNVCAQGNDFNPTCAGFGDVDGVWYSWPSGASNTVSIDFGPAATPDVGDSAAANISIAMFSGNCANLTELNCLAGPVVAETVSGLDIATTYYFMVFTDADVDQGQFDLTLTGGVGGCTTEGACNYDASATLDDGSCDLSCVGCTDPTAINFNPDATFDDGSCEFCTGNVVTITAGGGTFDNEITWELLSSDGSGVPVASGAAETVVLCLVDDCYTVNMFDSFGDGWNGATITLTDDAGIELGSGTIPAGGNAGTFDIGVGVSCPVLGCTDATATNYDPAADTDDGSCIFVGCTDIAACNFDGLSVDDGGSLTDDGSCCLENCITVTVTDAYGDGGTSVTLFDDAFNNLGSVTVTGFEASATFCIADICMNVVVSTDNWPAEAGVNVTSTDGVLLDNPTGTYLEPEDDFAQISTVVTVGNAVGCVVSGCIDATALNYNPEANADCFDVVGGTNISCCNFPVENNDCDGAIALTAGVELNWDSSLSNDSGNNCSPTLTNDVWYTYTPTCDQEVSISSSSGQGGQVAVWEGDCAALTLVECAPNDGLAATTTLEVVLTGGVTYSIQTGSNSDFGPTSTGTILLEEGLCRGCTYVDSPDYDVNAGIDDGSCTFEDCSCPGDFTGDGFVNVSDLGGFLGAFGTPCAP